MIQVAPAAWLELLRTEVRALGPDTWRVRMAVANSGWLPAYVSRRALQRKVVRGGVMFEIHLPEGDPSVTLVSGRQRMEGPRSRATPKHSLHRLRAGREVTADRARRRVGGARRRHTGSR